MSLPRYREYKDSGVTWLGAVPSHWKVLRFKWLMERNDGGVWGDDPDGIDDTVVLRSTEQTVDGRWRIEAPAKRRLTEGDRLSALLGVGDLLLTKSSGSALHIGKTTLVDEQIAELGACYSNFMQRIRVGADLSPKLAWYILNNAFARVQLDLLSNSTTGLANLNGTIIGDLVLAVAPQDEQAAIAAFLDRETAKIDALIAEQEKLIALLAEKRQATISLAVTRGLDPHAPMTDSEVAWLGTVPAHWEIKSIRYILEAMGDVDHYMPTSVEKGVPYLMTGDLKESLGAVSLDDCKQVSYSDYLELSRRIRSSRGDVIMARYATIGALMYVDIDVDFLVSYSCVTLKTKRSEMSGRYLFQYMKSDAFRLGVEQQVNTNTQGNVGIKDLQNLKAAVPPIDEQAAIVAFIDSEAQKLDSLRTESERAISLLRERRSALITAAVTGQIDVRGPLSLHVINREELVA